MSRPFHLIALALASFTLAPLALAQSPQEDYDRAFRLEHEEGAYDRALELYRQVATASGAGEELRARAHRRAHSVAEEIACSDFAQLMPSDAILYVEINRPGEELASLLDQLGLLGSWQDVVSSGARSFAVSPELINGLFGARGAALAINRVPMGSGPPGGVLVLHAGDLGVVRGLFETALPAGGTPQEPIEGQPTWSIEGQAYVTLTSRLLIASQDREEIAGVIRRLRGERDDSLAAAPTMQKNLELRRGDLFYFCVNVAPVRPLLAIGMQMAAAHDPQVALAAAALDLESLEALVGRAGVEPDGLSMDLLLRLDEGHRNLVFNLLRSAPLDRRSLELVPEGAAGFVSWSYNQRGPAIGSLEENADGDPVVTAMDFGREFFANLVGVTLFALPPEGAAGAPIPAVAAVISANDPARSRAVWNLVLAAASLASGASMEPGTTEIAGRSAESYQLPVGFPVYVVGLGNEIVVSPSRSAIERAIVSRERGRSVLDDPAFAEGIGRIDDGTTGAAMIHLGRAALVAGPLLPPEMAADSEMGAALGVLERTVVSIVSRHSPTEMGVSIALHGLPKVNGLVARALAAEQERGQSYAAAYGVEPKAAMAATDELLEAGESDPDLLRRKFDLLVERDDVEAARAVGRDLLESVDDARFLNNLAWALLTEERYGERFDGLALHASVASNEASDHGVWQYLDTLALARFRHGEIERAIELEKKALELAGDRDGREEMLKTLERYRAALEETVAAETSTLR